MRITLVLSVFVVDPVMIKNEDTFLKSNHVVEFLKLPSSYWFVVFQGLEFLFLIITKVVLTLFVIYYSFICRYIQILLRYLLDQLKDKFIVEDFEKFVHIHENTLKIISDMNEHFSFLSFVAVIMSIVGLFWSGYRLAFNADMTPMYLISLIYYAVFYLTHQLLIMISAAKVNEEADKATAAAQCLPYRISNRHQEIKFTLKGSFVQNNRLTLWNIYVLDRSLIINCFGALLTYGILLGTLGKET
ncbi:uncharacterized protein NPIL_357541 [Nephila pilipes]|uniref:Uncharacterized protein n=1 Tax=Nephila pilipes TaxID=299642 RepID=A0A8X6UGV0_NEPPI|nr:uncharacterized protein NPIL_357541 [Nephila pilipes]